MYVCGCVGLGVLDKLALKYKVQRYSHECFESSFVMLQRILGLEFRVKLPQIYVF